MTDVSPSRARWLVFAVRGAITGLLLGVGLHLGYVLGGSNFRTVLPGAVYRCAQPTGPQLERLIRRHGIRTVVNLRGPCPSTPWYRNEALATARTEACQEDVALSATRLPSALSIRKLIDVLDRSAYPLLVHCHQGADRTGLVAVLAVLLHTDATLPEGLRHLGPQSGHVPFGKTRNIDVFFDLYEDWLRDLGEEHSPGLLRAWCLSHYCAGDGRAEITVREALEQRPGRSPVLRLQANQARLVTVRCRNLSSQPWRFHPESNVGVHLFWLIQGSADEFCKSDRQGMFHATVAPGAAVDLRVPLPPLPPGTYQLFVDLTNERQGFFVQLGNEPCVIDLEVT